VTQAGRHFYLHLGTGKTQWTPPSPQECSDADIAGAALEAAKVAHAAKIAEAAEEGVPPPVQEVAPVAAPAVVEETPVLPEPEPEPATVEAADQPTPVPAPVSEPAPAPAPAPAAEPATEPSAQPVELPGSFVGVGGEAGGEAAPPAGETVEVRPPVEGEMAI
jgi:outer membrane biosynthesis protein TonB